MFDIATVNFEKGNGTVTVVTQHAETGELLMVAAADRDALEKSVETREMHYLSRTRGPWHKGATSGNTQRVVSLTVDCDGDAVLARVIPHGPTCHNGTNSCFVSDSAGGTVAELDRVIQGRVDNPSASSYTTRLLGDRNLRLKKLGEETAELVLALADGDRVRATEEAADIVYHLMVALRAETIGWNDVLSVLARRSTTK